MLFKVRVLSVDNSSTLDDFKVNYLVLTGYSGRDKATVLKHIEELEKLGVPKPPKVPMFYVVSKYLLQSCDEVEVVDSMSSGEVEYVVFVRDGKIVYVTVGSDHTDRDVERINILKSKQMYPKVIPYDVWRYEDVKDHWDELVIRSYTTYEGSEILYQEASLSIIRRPEELVRLTVEWLGIEADGLVLFSGTVPLKTGKVVFGDSFRYELVDPILGRKLEFRYRVKVLPIVRGVSY
jgi:hypothetical protein